MIVRSVPRASRSRGEVGLTLIELLVVMVVIPLIIGAVAEVLIVSFKNQGSTSNRLSDSDNAQLTSSYLIRDVVGASYVTTVDNSTGGTYFSNAPQVCKPTAGGTFLLGLFHPASSGGSALDVGYWLVNSGTATEIDRYSCTLSSTWTSSSPSLTAVASGPPATLNSSGGESIVTKVNMTPVQFLNGASLQWTPTGAFTTSSGTISNLSAASTITVGSTVGFTTGTLSGVNCSPSPTLSSATGCSSPTPLTIETTLGPTQVSCSGFTLTSFTGCTSTSAGAVTDSSSITQSSLTAAQLTVSQPASSYIFSLLASPRSGAPQLSSANTNPPTLLTLGTSGINPIHGGGSSTCPDAARANICIGNGGVVIDAGGTVFCTGAGPHTYIHFESGAGSVDSVAPGSSSRCNTVQVANSNGIPDPIKQGLPNNGCLTNTFVNSLPQITTQPAGTSTPGVYATTQPTGLLEPGIYVVENGLGSVTGMTTPASSDQYFHPSSTNPYYNAGAAYDPTAGVLLYVPGVGPYPSSQNCFKLASLPTGLHGSGSNSDSVGGTVQPIAPLDSTQSADSFGGDTGLASLWLWQDATNTNPVSITGTTANGFLYAPAATFNLGGGSTLKTGGMIVSGISMNGTDTLILSWT